MRLLFLTLCLLLGVVIAPAKDIITKTDGTKTEAIVVEITETAVKFRKPSNPNGPVYNLPLKSVATITYENGTIDYFNQAPPVATSPASNAQLSDEELINMSEAQIPASQNSYVSDCDLLLLSMAYSPVSPDDLRRKAKVHHYFCG